ncbi:hypothetical protein DOTSEDRAFT_69460 [Dothistroma septosporum NZE10]|uniref:Methyltransferase domain-containing protein n=1 Tax=Dothistroma septosporum (strain NZE10 / CBS 128990) TaxID=675120 RepID=N1PVV5_DOTSN|nr:hypothetical protein DOTSEDRAFT_69460 [Dothistroma septosporum NZE10]
MTAHRRFWMPWRSQKRSRTSQRIDDNDGDGIATDEVAMSSRISGKALSQCQYMLPALFTALGENADLKILDVGCGFGAIAIELSQLVSGAQVTGIDISGAALESAKVQAEKLGVHHIKFMKADACDLPFEACTFDVVHTHQAVAHFGDPVKAIREMKRITKKGGMICMREGDLRTGKFGSGYPQLDECFQIILELHRTGGGAVDAGRRLKDWSVKAGVPRSGIVETHSAWTCDTLEGRKAYGGYWPARCRQGVFANMARDLGVTSERLEEYALAWSRWIQDPDASFTMMHGKTIGTV